MRKTVTLLFLLFALLLTSCTNGSLPNVDGEKPTPDPDPETETDADTDKETETDKDAETDDDTESKTEETGRNMNICVNIAADGFEGQIIKSTLSSPSVYREEIEKYVANYLDGTNVGRMIYNVAYRRSVVDSDTVDSMVYNVVRDADGFLVRDENGNTKKTLAPETTAPMLKLYKSMIERGIDLFEMAVEETHRYEAEAWFSIRMNDHHYTDDPGFNTSFSYDTPEVSGIDGSRKSMDFTKPAVQAYYREYVRELCEKYDIDGIELDFLRSCPIMSSATPENREILNEYIASLRAVINEVAEAKGKTIGLSVRVYAEEAQNLDYGIDVAQWIADGSVDQVTVSGWYIPTYYNIPIEAWRESIDARNVSGNSYTLLAGTDWGVRCDSRPYVGYVMWITLEQFRGFVSASYEKGADGIYIFNHFLPSDDHGGTTYYVDSKGNKTRELVLKDKLIAADSQKAAEKGTRVYVHTCRDSENTLYPIKLASTPYTFTVNTGTAPETEYIVRVGIDANKGYDRDLISVKVNGFETENIEDVPCERGFVWTESTASEPVAQHVSETCAGVLQFSLPYVDVLEDGVNTIVISSNNSAFPQSIKWIEICVK